jgi:hypothetical protein
VEVETAAQEADPFRHGLLQLLRACRAAPLFDFTCRNWISKSPGCAFANSSTREKTGQASQSGLVALLLHQLQFVSGL